MLLDCNNDLFKTKQKTTNPKCLILTLQTTNAQPNLCCKSLALYVWYKNIFIFQKQRSV